MDRLSKIYRLRPTSFVLIISNLWPLFGVLFFGWGVASILLVYWIESVIVGFFAIGKILVYGVSKGKAASIIRAGFDSFFLCIHFGLFLLVHLVLITTFVFNKDVNGGGLRELLYAFYTPLGQGVIYAAIPLFVSHGWSFLANYIGKKEYEKISYQESNNLMLAPYLRVFVSHITLLFGGFILSRFNYVQGFIAILVLIKIYIDVGMHEWEHKPHKEETEKEWVARVESSSYTKKLAIVILCIGFGFTFLSVVALIRGNYKSGADAIIPILISILFIWLGFRGLARARQQKNKEIANFPQ